MLDKKIILALGVSAAAAIAGGLYLTTDIFQPPEKKAKNAVAYRNAEPASRSSPHILKKEVTPEKKEVLPPSKETFSAGTLAELTGLQADRDLSKMAVQLAAEKQRSVQHRTMLLDVPQMLSAPHSDRLGIFFVQHQTGDVIITL